MTRFQVPFVAADGGWDSEDIDGFEEAWKAAAKHGHGVYDTHEDVGFISREEHQQYLDEQARLEQECEDQMARAQEAHDRMLDSMEADGTAWWPH